MRSAALLSVSTLAIFSLACSSSHSGSPDAGPQQTQMVGAQGGTISLSNGVTVTLPAGALAADTNIGVAWVADPTTLNLAALPDGIAGPLEGALVLTPHGTQFNAPVQVSIPATAPDAEYVLLRLPNETSTAWAPDGAVTKTGNTLQFSVYQFSVYSVAAVAAGACPCWTGASLDAYFAANPGVNESNFSAGVASVSSATCPNIFVAGGPSFSGYSECAISNDDAKCSSIAAASNISDAQFTACDALLVSRYKHQGTVGLEVGAFATGVPANVPSSVSVQLTIGTAAPQTLVLPSGQQLVWATGVYDLGTNVAATVTSAPAGYTCLVGAGTGPLGKQNVAVEVDCRPAAPVCTSAGAACDDGNACTTDDTCASGKCAGTLFHKLGVASDGVNPPTLALTPSSTFGLSETFNGAALNPALWEDNVSSGASVTFDGSELVVAATGGQQGNFGLQPSGDPNHDLELFTTDLDLTLTFALATPAVAPNGSLLVTVSLPQSTTGPSSAALFTAEVFATGSSYSLAVISSGANDTQTNLSLAASTTNTLRVQYNHTTGVALATLTSGGTTTTATETVAPAAGWNVAVGWQGTPAGTSAQTVLDLAGVSTTLTTTTPAQWNLSSSPLTVNGTNYDFAAPMTTGAVWLGNTSGAAQTSLSVSAPSPVTFDGSAPAVYARLLSATNGTVSGKATIYSPLSDSDFATALPSFLGAGGTATVDVEVIAFLQQADGSYKFALPACP